MPTKFKRPFECLRHVVFGAVSPQGTPFLERPRKEAKPQLPSTKAPALRTAALCQLASLKHELTTTPPRLFLARHVFRGGKSPVPRAW